MPVAARLPAPSPGALDRPVRRFTVSPEEEERIVTAFAVATGTGDVEALVKILAADANTYTDGGGVVVAARKPIYGAAKSARFLIGVQRKFDYRTGWCPSS